MQKPFIHPAVTAAIRASWDEILGAEDQIKRDAAARPEQRGIRSALVSLEIARRLRSLEGFTTDELVAGLSALALKSMAENTKYDQTSGLPLTREELTDRMAYICGALAQQMFRMVGLDIEKIVTEDELGVSQ